MSISTLKAESKSPQEVRFDSHAVDALYSIQFPLFIDLRDQIAASNSHATKGLEDDRVE